MSKTEFGYSEESQGGGGWSPASSTQMHTTRPVEGKLKEFLDTELLEGKCPDKFSDVQAFYPWTLKIAQGKLDPS